MSYKVSPLEIKVDINDKYSVLHTYVRSKSMLISEVGPFVHDKSSSQGKHWIPKSKYQDKIIHDDLAHNYFEFAIFKFKSSILLRDFFYTFTETKAKWATTQRFSKLDNVVVSSEAVHIKDNDIAFAEYEDAIKKFHSGEIKIFNKAREMMPLSHQVEWQIGMPMKQFIRCLAVLLHNLGQNDPMWKEVYVTCYKNKVIRPWLDLLPKYMHVNEINEYTYIDPLPYNKKDAIVINPGMILYSHLIRHEDTRCIGFMDFMKDIVKGNFEGVPNCNQSFKCTIVTSPIRWRATIRTRTAWFAITDDWNSNNSWSLILKKYIKEKHPKIEDYKWMFAFFDENGNFDNSAEVDSVEDGLRLHKGYNNDFPNAFTLQSRDIVLQRIAKFGNNPLMEMYLQVFDHGYIKDNPHNEYRLRWESLCKESE